MIISRIVRRRCANTPAGSYTYTHTHIAMPAGEHTTAVRMHFGVNASLSVFSAQCTRRCLFARPLFRSLIALHDWLLGVHPRCKYAPWHTAIALLHSLSWSLGQMCVGRLNELLDLLLVTDLNGGGKVVGSSLAPALRYARMRPKAEDDHVRTTWLMPFYIYVATKWEISMVHMHNN